MFTSCAKIDGKKVVAVRAVKLYEGFTFSAEYTLLDFFTFSCINCTNNIAKLNTFNYDEVEIIGIHTPKFTFEKNDAHLSAAIKELGIDYQVIQDNEHKLANEYAIKAWPTIVVVDKNAYIVDTYVGEKDIDALELFLNEKFQKREIIQTKERFFNKVYAFQEEDKEKIAVAHSDGVSVYDENGILIKEYLIGPCEGIRYYQDKLYAICKQNVILLCNNTKIISFNNPSDLEFVKDELFVSDASLHQIIVLDANTLKEKRRYGNRFEALRDGKLEEAQLAQPSALASLYDELYFVDAESSSLRYIYKDKVKTLIGEGLFEFGDSHEEPILLQHPTGLCVGKYGDGCGGGRVFIADTFNKKIKVYDRESNAIMNLCVLEEAPYSISKMGCNLYILCKEKIIKFNLSAMKSEVFIEK